MTEANIERLHAIIEGRVQGVGFRYFVLENARALGVTGWVRNRWDGTVEVLAEGERKKLEKLLLHLQRGPRSASVYKITTDWEKATGDFTDFIVRMTV